MTRIEKFEDMKIWQKAKELTFLVYLLFKNNKDFRFRDQIQSASLSIMNNTAEGFERRGLKEFNRFLFIAKGSAAEVRSMSYVALELGYLSKDDFQKVYNLSVEISKMISGFVKTL